MNIELDKITLDIDGKKLELTLKQCEELKNILDKLIEKKPEFTINSPWCPPNGTITFPTYPYKISDYPFPQPVITWCGTNKDYTITVSN